MMKTLIHAWICSSLVIILVHAQEGFISIDCRINESYTDGITGINYISDESYIDTGVSKSIAPEYDSSTLEMQYLNVRSFPEGNRNCYTLKPEIGEGDKYLIRATFMYGNYDGNRLIPEFELHLGVNLWDSVKFDNYSDTPRKEIIYKPKTDYIDVCLVNIGSGTPFISALELRVLKNSTYVAKSAIVLMWRWDVGSSNNETVRYGDDAYDRIWKPENYPYTGQLSTSLHIGSRSQNEYQLPSAIMSTAITPINDSRPLTVGFEPDDSKAKYYFYMHFAEVEELQKNELREFNITKDGEILYESFVPLHLNSFVIYNIKPFSGDVISMSLIKTEKAILPPILNAVECYKEIDMLQSQTDPKDVNAMINIKSINGITKNWQGDPCAPKACSWDGLNCSYDGYDPPRIIALDLSNNNLTGPVPNFLTQMKSLKLINLKGNNLSGPIPAQLVERAEKGLLTLSVDESTTICTSCNNGKKINSIILIVASVAGVSFVLLAGLVVFLLIKRRKQQDVKINNSKEESLEITNQHFTYTDVLRITNNLKIVLGEGGFGKVYHGYMDDKTQVAVKILSKSSGQGYKEFQAEVKLLMRVHQRNLTALVGYCNEDTNKALIYEYMANENLAMHFSDKSSRILTWEDRMRIAVDSAQGFEYLHECCKPPIVHRDVKCENILLNENFQAKIADFGLSRETQVSTVVAGTPGYLDPEYYATNWLSEKSDVSSFGMVILVIITGRPIISSTHENISQWVSSMVEKGDINKIIDSRLRGDFNTNSVWKAVEIALKCVSFSSTERPNMTQVVAELNECLAVELAQRDTSYDANHSKYSDEIAPRTFDSETIPFAR